jgi:hypothetical protein
VITKRTTVSFIGLGVLAVLTAACSGSPSTNARSPAVTQPPAITAALYGVTSASIGVPAFSYQVQVFTTGPCWVQANSGSGQILFSGVVLPHEARTFKAADGKVSLQLGSVQVKVTVLIDGKIVPRWGYIPKSSPYTVSFASVG